MNEKVSIIIPCYNVSFFLEKCINSVLTQSYNNIEVICVNDGSTDQTAQILNYYALQDKRVKVVNQNNQGLSAARNIGVDFATGTWVIYVDADDWIDISIVEELVNASLGRAMVCCSYYRVWQKKMIPRNLNLSYDVDVSFVQRRITGLIGNELSDPTQADSLVTAWGKLYQLKIIKENNIKFIDTNEIGTEDCLFNIMYLEKCLPYDQVYIINKALYYYRKYNQSLSTSYKQNLHDKWSKLYLLIDDIVKNKNSEFSKALNNRICLSVIGLGFNELFSEKSFSQINNTLKKIFSDKKYCDAFAGLSMRYFPLHWKIFFFFTKKKMTIPVILILKVINNLNNKK